MNFLGQMIIILYIWQMGVFALDIGHLMTFGAPGTMLIDLMVSPIGHILKHRNRPFLPQKPLTT
jgi:hypothetical protein